MARIIGFKPCFEKDAKALILGSFPSVISRRTDFYYGNPRNRFWHTLALAFGEETPKSKDEKIALLGRRGLALWDVVGECEIDKSQDSSIKNYTVVDLDRVLDYAKIKLILLNGAKAAQLFNKHYSWLKIESVALPSTSPANVRFDLQRWLDALKKV